MQVNTLLCKDKAISTTFRNVSSFSEPKLIWFQQTDTKRKSVLWSNGSTLYIVFVTHRHHVLQADKEKDHSHCYQSRIPKPATVMVCAVSNDMSNICEGTITAERSSRLFQRCHILHVCQQHGFLVNKKKGGTNLARLQVRPVSH